MDFQINHFYYLLIGIHNVLFGKKVVEVTEV